MSKSVRKDPIFTGPFAEMCVAFVSYKRAQGIKYMGQIYLLRAFDDFCKDFKIESQKFPLEIAQAWSQPRNNESELHRSSRILVMRQFVSFLEQNGYEVELPMFKFKRDRLHTPYIFTHDEIRKMIQEVDEASFSQKSTSRHLTFPMLYRMLYACGFRINEVLSLKLGDVDLKTGVVHLNKTKNNIERLVPMSDSLTEYCRKYVSIAHCGHSLDYPYIFTMHGEHYCISAIERHFRDSMWSVGISYGGKRLGPRIHDLRHTFACHQLYKWTTEGTDLMIMLPILSKYLGRKGVLSTQWYLRLTAEAFPDVTEKMNLLTASVFPEIGGEYIAETD